jgi:phosphopantothenoylcysteine decarboxylase/phosphopantothenate--cysteine ligase
MPEPAVLVGVGGSIAAYKAADVVSALRKKGARVTVLLSRNARHFVAPLALKTLSGRPLGEDLFNEPPEWGVGHVQLAKEADAYVVVAATADLLAKLAVGIADDFVTTAALVYHPKPLLLAPAMNTAMLKHPAVQAHLRTLKARGARVLDPCSGLLACGDVGDGKLVDPAVIAEETWAAALRSRAGTAAVLSVRSGEASLQGKKVLVSAGPTREPLDPVRYLSNPSTGKMGYAVAEACRDLGAEVTLVSGPSALPDPEGVKTMRVTTAREMLQACRQAFLRADAFVAAAAVSDFRPAVTAAQKKKKNGRGERLRLEPNPDILLTLSKRKGKRVLVGFAAETEKLLEHAQEKFRKKNLDLLVANRVGSGRGFGTDDTEVLLLRAGREPERLGRQPKTVVAARIAAELAALLGSQRA